MGNLGFQIEIKAGWSIILKIFPSGFVTCFGPRPFFSFPSSFCSSVLLFFFPSDCSVLILSSNSLLSNLSTSAHWEGLHRRKREREDDQEIHNSDSIPQNDLDWSDKQAGGQQSIRSILSTRALWFQEGAKGLTILYGDSCWPCYVSINQPTHN